MEPNPSVKTFFKFYKLTLVPLPSPSLPSGRNHKFSFLEKKHSGKKQRKPKQPQSQPPSQRITERLVGGEGAKQWPCWAQRCAMESLVIRRTVSSLLPLQTWIFKLVLRDWGSCAVVGFVIKKKKKILLLGNKRVLNKLLNNEIKGDWFPRGQQNSTG